MTDPLTTEQLSHGSRRLAASSLFSLLVVCDGVSSTYPLPERGHVLIGRAKHAEVRIEHGSLSREHARLHVGEGLELEDLGSANGTHVRGRALTLGTPVEILPHDVIELGRVLMVVQHRRLEQRLRRVCAPEFFELRVEEESARVPAVPFFVAQVEAEGEGELGSQASEYLLASALPDSDLISQTSAGLFRILLLGADEREATGRLQRATQVLADRNLRVTCKLSSPRAGGSSGTSDRPARGQSETKLPVGGAFVIADESMRRVCKLLERVAASELSVLLLGETGVGKEMCAELLHHSSPRRSAPLLRMNCAAMPETLLESELFGYERGAFTGATTSKAGLLETADGGSLFLDEVGDIPLSTQIKLLRVVESKQVLRLGGRSPRAVDVRVIAATNQDLQELITVGRFREDLFYRLNGISVLVPPLRERQADIEPLARHFMARAAQQVAKVQLSAASLRFLREHAWPGNVRELRNSMQRAVLLCDGELLEPEHLQPGIATASASSVPVSLHEEVKLLERVRIEQALRDAEGSQRRAAVLLGISRGALLRRLKDLKLG